MFKEKRGNKPQFSISIVNIPYTGPLKKSIHNYRYVQVITFHWKQSLTVQLSDWQFLKKGSNSYIVNYPCIHFLYKQKLHQTWKILTYNAKHECKYTHEYY